MTKPRFISNKQVKYIKSEIEYNPDTGIFIWKKSRSGVKVNSIAGSRKSDGYIHIGVMNQVYKAHRLVFIFMDQPLPDYVDHINGVRDDNRWENLRPCSNSENCSNSKKRSDNTSGIKGVSWHKPTNKWVAYICNSGKQIHLGTFDCIAHAACVRVIAEDEHHKEFAYQG